MFSPGLTCKLCVHVSQTDVHQDDPKEEHMQSRFFSLINHVHSTKSISTLCLIWFYSDSIAKFPGVVASLVMYEAVDYMEMIVAVKMMTTKEMYELTISELARRNLMINERCYRGG